METDNTAIRVSKEIESLEFAALMSAVGWGQIADYPSEVVRRSLTAYPFVAHARNTQGQLVGYVSAFSDGAFSAFIGELVAHPSVQRYGVGSRLLEAVESYCKGIPVYAKPFADVEEFFLKQGYRRATRAMSVLFKLNRPAA
jgi:GNAT superfamily N-acetyltransferase